MANRKGQRRQYSIDTTLVYSFSAALYVKLIHLKWNYLQQMRVFVKNGRKGWGWSVHSLTAQGTTNANSLPQAFQMSVNGSE